ncbi:MAG TPA: T9SS type A sorting domain-containing protein, partial [Chitinophagaceae bacterium]|nr:T9SS type A sorting domain-containing protein [Chitinophagaceae bacterium]
SSSSVIDSFNVTALDIDGNGSTLHEWDAFYSPVSYTLENPSLLQVTNLVVSSSNVGKTFTGDLMDHPGIDTSSTDIMTTLRYNGVSSIKIRLGATTTGSASTNRMYSIWFKNFSYNAPLKVLPVKLASFNATLNKNKVDLKWTTSSEQNVSHFVVERSFDGINFNDAGLVFAVGNSTQNVDYSFSDDISNVQANMIYYRLCSVDIDGKTDYSEVRVIRLNKQTDNSVTIITYPNPVNNELRITVPASWQNKKIAFELFNANGQLSKKTENASSSQTETINVSDLARGFYVVRVTCNGETAQQKIIKN